MAKITRVPHKVCGRCYAATRQMCKIEHREKASPLTAFRLASASYLARISIAIEEGSEV